MKEKSTNKRKREQNKQRINKSRKEQKMKNSK